MFLYDVSRLFYVRTLSLHKIVHESKKGNSILFTSTLSIKIEIFNRSMFHFSSLFAFFPIVYLLISDFGTLPVNDCVLRFLKHLAMTEKNRVLHLSMTLRSIEHYL